MTKATANIVLDSFSNSGVRLTTFQLRYWRPIHSELMTHRVFSRNAGSSRARPSAKIIEQVRNDPWGPIHWGLNEPGMQANTEATGILLEKAKVGWHQAACDAAKHAEAFLNAGFHKQIVNRLLEPFTYIDVVVTATDFANWFALRDHEDAMPEIRELAQLMKDQYLDSIPKLIQEGEWHLPYITEDDWLLAHAYAKEGRITRDEPGYREKLDIVRKVSAARCARVSYKAFDGKVAPIEKDLVLFEQLLVSQPLHASPAEHQATPDELMWIQKIAVASPEQFEAGEDNEDLLGTVQEWCQPEHHGNFTGWCQYRKMLPNEFVPG